MKFFLVGVILYLTILNPTYSKEIKWRSWNSKLEFRSPAEALVTETFVVEMISGNFSILSRHIPIGRKARNNGVDFSSTTVTELVGKGSRREYERVELLSKGRYESPLTYSFYVEDLDNLHEVLITFFFPTINEIDLRTKSVIKTFEVKYIVLGSIELLSGKWGEYQQNWVVIPSDHYGIIENLNTQIHLPHESSSVSVTPSLEFEVFNDFVIFESLKNVNGLSIRIKFTNQNLNVLDFNDWMRFDDPTTEFIIFTICVILIAFNWAHMVCLVGWDIVGFFHRNFNLKLPDEIDRSNILHYFQDENLSIMDIAHVYYGKNDVEHLGRIIVAQFLDLLIRGYLFIHLHEDTSSSFEVSEGNYQAEEHRRRTRRNSLNDVTGSSNYMDDLLYSSASGSRRTSPGFGNLDDDRESMYVESDSDDDDDDDDLYTTPKVSVDEILRAADSFQKHGEKVTPRPTSRRRRVLVSRTKKKKEGNIVNTTSSSSSSSEDDENFEVKKTLFFTIQKNKEALREHEKKFLEVVLSSSTSSSSSQQRNRTSKKNINRFGNRKTNYSTFFSKTWSEEFVSRKVKRSLGNRPRYFCPFHPVTQSVYLLVGSVFVPIVIWIFYVYFFVHVVSEISEIKTYFLWSLYLSMVNVLINMILVAIRTLLWILPLQCHISRRKKHLSKKCEMMKEAIESLITHPRLDKRWIYQKRAEDEEHNFNVLERLVPLSLLFNNFDSYTRKIYFLSKYGKKKVNENNNDLILTDDDSDEDSESSDDEERRKGREVRMNISAIFENEEQRGVVHRPWFVEQFKDGLIFSEPFHELFQNVIRNLVMEIEEDVVVVSSEKEV